MKRDAAALKNQRLKEIAKRIAKAFAAENVTSLRVKPLITWIQYELGLTEERAKEYVQLVCDMHEWLLSPEFIRKSIPEVEEKNV